MRVLRFRRSRTISMTIAVLAVVALLPLLAWDTFSKLVPLWPHEPLAAAPLSLIAVACILDAVVRRAPPAKLT